LHKDKFGQSPYVPNYTAALANSSQDYYYYYYLSPLCRVFTLNIPEINHVPRDYSGAAIL
jgi:hypothetical protein